jgi:hypothetical protein
MRSYAVQDDGNRHMKRIFSDMAEWNDRLEKLAEIRQRVAAEDGKP